MSYGWVHWGWESNLQKVSASVGRDLWRAWHFLLFTRGQLTFCHSWVLAEDAILRLEAKCFYYSQYHHSCALHILGWFLIPSWSTSAGRCTYSIDAVQAVKLAVQAESLGTLRHEAGAIQPLTDGGCSPLRLHAGNKTWEMTPWKSSEGLAFHAVILRSLHTLLKSRIASISLYPKVCLSFYSGIIQN